jgi:HEAT repeat protein
MAEPDDSLALHIEQLSAAESDLRAGAAEALCRAADAARPAIVPLVKACGDEDARVREWAVAALEEIGEPASDTIPALAGLAGSGHPLVAYWAVTLLGRSAAAEAAPSLTACLDVSCPVEVRQRAAWALGKIGPAAKGAFEALRRAQGDADPRLARLAGEALAAIGG